MSKKSQQENNNNCHQKQQVQFSNAVDDICYLRDVPLSSMMTKKEKKSTWYSYEDITNMKTDAKKLALRLREDAGSLTQSSSPVDNGRGLEIIIFRGRQLKRYIAARTIMECLRRNKLNIAAAKKYGNPNILQLAAESASLKLGHVSTKCSQWARDMALMTGHLDFKEVYSNDETPLPKLSIEQRYQLPLKRKRAHVPYSVGEIEIKRHNKRKMIDAENLSNSLSIPFNRMRHNIPPPSIC